jgi:hypothetical protein
MEPITTAISIIASVITTITGIGWILDRNGKRIDDRFGTIINHMEKMELVLEKMREDLPLKYTLREDHLRLVERVDELQRVVPLRRFERLENN